jgi:hypothetical protein
MSGTVAGSLQVARLPIDLKAGATRVLATALNGLSERFLPSGSHRHALHIETLVSK